METSRVEETGRRGRRRKWSKVNYLQTQQKLSKVLELVDSTRVKCIKM